MNLHLPSWLNPWAKKNSVSTPTDILKEIAAQAGTLSGVKVTWETALQANTALACAKVIAEGLAQVPFKVFLRRADDGADLAKDEPSLKMLSVCPNPWQTSYEFREQVGLHLAFLGNAYIFKVRGLGGRVAELLPLEPQHVIPKRDDQRNTTYEVTVNGKKIKVPGEDIWHLRGISWDGFLGLDGIKLAQEAIGLTMALEEHGARMFSNGSQPGGILTTESMLDKDQVKDIRDAWQEKQGGGANAYKAAVLYGGLKWQSMAQTGVESQHLEQRRFQVEEVCRGFHVMPIMVGQADKAATYASAEQMFLAHIVYTMMPWYARIEQSADVNVLSEQEQDKGLFTKFVVNGLMRGAPKDRAKFYETMIKIKAMTPNEVRKLEEMNPLEGGDDVVETPAPPANTPPNDNQPTDEENENET